MNEPDCFVYVIARQKKDRYLAPVKIGISHSPWSRIASMQTACPFKIELAWIFECPNREIARFLEKMFHETQAARAMHGEWFKMRPIEAIHLLCTGYRVILHESAKLEPQEHIDLLEKAGVIWAEKRFGLNVPKAVMQ